MPQFENEPEDREAICRALGCEGANHTVTCPLHKEPTAVAAAAREAEMEVLRAKMERQNEDIFGNEQKIAELTERQKEDQQIGEEMEKSALKKWEASVRVELKRRGFTEERVEEILKAHADSVRQDKLKAHAEKIEAELEEKRELSIRFTYHPPKGDQGAKYKMLRAAAKDLAELITNNCPPCRERHLALTKLEEAVMWANAAIARRS